MLWHQRPKNGAKWRTFLVVYINSDHDLVMMTVKLKLKKNFRNHGLRLGFNLEKLKDPQVADLLEATIGGKFSALDLLKKRRQFHMAQQWSTHRQRI